MKQITIAGNVGRDAEIRTTQGGTHVCGFSVAVKARKKDDPPTWFTVSIFGKRGEALAQYVTKGSSVVVTGDLEPRTYTGKDGTTKLDLGVVASEITLLGGKAESSGRPAHNLHRTEAPKGDGFGDEFGGDEIPF